MLERKIYIEKILEYKDKNLIKVLVGIRRSGKSTILRQIMRELKNVLFVDLELPEFIAINDETKLMDYLKKAKYKEYKYLFFDEVQNVAGWEKVINALHKTGKFDIYITGSNSSLLSTEISTLLTGRFIHFEIMPFSYVEYLQIKSGGSLKEYIAKGGFPIIYDLDLSDKNFSNVLNEIRNSIVLKDITEKYKIRNPEVFERIFLFAINNIGNIFSAKSIADYYKAENIKLNVDTTILYLKYLCDAFVLSKVGRYDVIGKKFLKIDEKYYLADHGFLTAAYSDFNKFLPGILENIVYNELKRREYKNIYVGKVQSREVDFVAFKNTEEKNFYQVSYLMEEEKTFKRELDSLREIRSDSDKIILTLDKTRLGNYDGIEIMHLEEWLKNSP